MLRIFNFIPILGWLISFAASLWMLAAMVVAVRQALDYSGTGKALLVCVVSWVVAMIIQMAVLAPLFAGAALVSAL